VAEYEDKLVSLPKITSDINMLNRQNDALLVLLGEKEEELENTVQDMQDMKNLYKSEMEQLLCKAVIPDGTSTGTITGTNSSNPE
jgi:hypothetical protein